MIPKKAVIIPELTVEFLEGSLANDLGWWEECESSCEDALKYNLDIKNGDLDLDGYACGDYPTSALLSCHQCVEDEIEDTTFPVDGQIFARNICNKCCGVFALEETREIYDDFVYDVENIISDPYQNPIYRAIEVKDYKEFISEVKEFGKSTYKEKMVGVGTWWSANEDSAFVYSSGIKNKNLDFVVMEAVVTDPSAIDAETSLNSRFVYPDQEEISLNTGSKVYLESVRVEGVGKIDMKRDGVSI